MDIGIYTYTYYGNRRFGDKRPIKLIERKAGHDLNAPHSLIEKCGEKITLIGGTMAYALDPDMYEYAKEYLSITNDYVYQKDLENVLSLRRATVSGVLKTMEKNKLIKRTVDTNDTRVKEIILEERAKKIFLIKQKKMEELEKKLISNIQPEKIAVFSEVLENMIKKLERKEKDNIC